MGVLEKVKSKTWTKRDPSKHHPLRQELIDRRIPQSKAAKYCKLSRQCFYQYLVGLSPMPKAVEVKLERLILQVDEEEGR